MIKCINFTYHSCLLFPFSKSYQIKTIYRNKRSVLCVFINMILNIYQFYIPFNWNVDSFSVFILLLYCLLFYMALLFLNFLLALNIMIELIYFVLSIIYCQQKIYYHMCKHLVLFYLICRVDRNIYLRNE